MLVPFRRETFEQPRFIRDEVRFDLLHTIASGELAVALQAEDGGAVALRNTGFNLWLWIDAAMGEGYAAQTISELAERLKGAKLPGAVSAPEHAALFSDAYCRLSGAAVRHSTGLMGYSCPKVKMPTGVPGSMEKAGEEHLPRVADFMQGFNLDCFSVETGREDAEAAAAARINAGNVFLWSAQGKTVCMAAVAHRSPRSARIGYVYTPPAERNHGYAGALVAQLSLRVQCEGLLPVLYADMDNPVSNKVYRGIGYVEAGAVREYDFNQ